MSFKKKVQAACAGVLVTTLLGVGVVSTSAAQDSAVDAPPVVTNSQDFAEGRVTLADSPINDATLAVLADYGADLTVTSEDGSPRVTFTTAIDRDRAAQVYQEHTPFWNVREDVEGEAGLSVRVMSEENHDSGVVTSPYQAGDFTDTAGFLSVVDGEYITNGWSTNLYGAGDSFTQRIHGHTSWHNGGVPNSAGSVPLRTWALDDFAQVPSADFTAARAEAGALTHNPDTLSDATDGTTTVIVQLLAIKGELNEDYDFTGDDELAYNANQHQALALTDGLELVLDTSEVDWDSTPVGADGWAYQTVPDGYVAHMDEYQAVSLLDERVNDNVRTRTTRTNLWNFPGQPIDLGSEARANWQPAPTPEVSEFSEVRAAMYANEDGTYGIVFQGEGLTDGFELPTEYLEDEDGSFYFYLDANEDALLEDDEWVSEDGQHFFSWEQVSNEDGVLTVRLNTDAPVDYARGIPDIRIEEEAIAASPAFFTMGAQSFQTTYDLPWAQDDYASTVENNPVTIYILDNDGTGTDEGMLPIEVRDQGNVSATQPSNGSVEPVFIEAEFDGVVETWFQGFEYTPDRGFSGDDSFTYSWTDREGYEASATVFVEVSPLAAVNDIETTQMGQPVRIDILSNDNWVSAGFDFAAWFAANPNHEFQVTFTEPANGSVELVSLSYDEWVADGQGSPFYALYTPNEGFSGEDTFSYTWINPEGVERGADVVVTIEPGDTPDVPDTPDTPETPVITPPDTPDVPDTPGTPDEPGRSDTGIVADLTPEVSSEVEAQDNADEDVKADAPAGNLNPASLIGLAMGVMMAAMGALAFLYRNRGGRYRA